MVSNMFWSLRRLLPASLQTTSSHLDAKTLLYPGKTAPNNTLNHRHVLDLDQFEKSFLKDTSLCKMLNTILIGCQLSYATSF